MKKAFILAGFATIAFACNNNSNKDATTADNSNHSAHHGSAADLKSQNEMNPISETMEKMMYEMHGIKTTGNNDIDFAAMMVAHHQGAVEMSKIEVSSGTNAELKAFAQKVIDDQNKEIEFIQGFKSKAPKITSSNTTEFLKALNGSMGAMMNFNTTIYNDVDKDFAAQMIPHHQSAVDMAKAYLEYGQERSLRTLCQNIISSQLKEINWLKEWLAKIESSYRGL